ncbi:agamous-like MADS-box protein AGL80 [Vicia villosa]|uniref:agamous-like MADS-box protein AGL80 n=1 Tax=Vicia villosa TaxID=3911 RepID=UPI00273CF206|nr:agamous-like MADS-box protein AGL80 [Vicia villosa]XP_058754126.1 agamous-like MADS-box protein AGL80 [Vicia villosa]
MTRKKVKLAFISDDSARKATYKKRKKGIIKKVSELTILCGIPACAIISNPFDSKTEVWPDLDGAKQVIERYQSSSVIDGTKNVNQESFLLQRITKAREHLKKLRNENREKEMSIRMMEYMEKKDLPDDVSVSDLKEFEKLIEKNVKEIDNKIVALGELD